VLKVQLESILNQGEVADPKQEAKRWKSCSLSNCFSFFFELRWDSRSGKRVSLHCPGLSVTPELKRSSYVSLPSAGITETYHYT
jgi:hypothetical protein